MVKMKMNTPFLTEKWSGHGRTASADPAYILKGSTPGSTPRVDSGRAIHSGRAIQLSLNKSNEQYKVPSDELSYYCMSG